MDVAALIKNGKTATFIQICPKTFILQLGIFVQVFQKGLSISSLLFILPGLFARFLYFLVK